MRARSASALLLVAVACAACGAPAEVPAVPAPSAFPAPEAVATTNEPAPVPAAAEAAHEAPSRAPAPIPTPSLPVAPPPPIPAATKGGADTLVATLLAGGGPALKGVLTTAEKHRFQVIYGVVRTPEKGGATLERHAYRADAEYFFPASSMKVPIALAGYERLPTMRAAGRPSLDRDASIRMYPAVGDDPYVTSLARETWRALIVSDNTAANRLLSFVGLREANETLWGLKLTSARVRTGFSMTADSDPAEVSPRIAVVSRTGVTEEIPARKSELKLPPTKASSLEIGTAAIVDGRRVAGPMSFANKNAMSLRDLQDTLVRIVRPDLLPKTAPPSHATKEDIAYLRQALGTLPSKSGIAGYDRNVVADYQLVPFLRGLERVRPRDKLEIYTKVGQAYGFLTANAYIVDKDTGRGFFLLATVYANPDEVLNDDLYAYDAVAFPVLADVAEVIARHAFAP